MSVSLVDFAPWLFMCEGGCRGGYVLLGKLADGRQVCGSCWLRLGCPPSAEKRPVHEVEEETRKRMQARGGEDRHRVRAGKS